jgi:hypothetical protein
MKVYHIWESSVVDKNLDPSFQKLLDHNYDWAVFSTTGDP